VVRQCVYLGKYTLMYKDIQSFMQSQSVAIVGVSRNTDMFSYKLFEAFIRKGFRVYPVNPNCNELHGHKVYPSVTALPSDVDAIYIIKRKDLAIDIAREAAVRGITKIWIHVKCNNSDTAELTQKYGVTIIAGECFFMWAEPVRGVHRFHRFIRKLFDKTFPH